MIAWQTVRRSPTEFRSSLSPPRGSSIVEGSTDENACSPGGDFKLCRTSGLGQSASLVKVASQVHHGHVKRLSGNSEGCRNPSVAKLHGRLGR